jgi:hypothetical protein
MWRRNILHKRREEVKAALSDKLFILDPTFGPVLLYHRGLCKELENYRLVNLHSSSKDGLTLAEFAEKQNEQRKFLKSKIMEASQFSRARYHTAIKAVLDELRQRINEFAHEEE